MESDARQDDDVAVLTGAFHARRRGDFEGAIEGFRKVFDRDPSNPWPLIESAKVEFLRTDFLAMRDYLRQAEALAGGDPEVWLVRHLERIERHVDISNEALAVFVRFWLTSTPALPDSALAAAQTKGRERYEGFVEALGRRLARGRKLADEVSRDVTSTFAEGPDPQTD